MDPSMVFKGDVIIEGRNQALKEAKKNRMGLVLWTDGSKLDKGKVGTAVCWKDKRLGQWKEKSIFLGKNKEILDAELWAILEALGIARKETINDKDMPITIFCDSQKALKTIQQPPSHQENRVLRSLIYQKAGELQSNGYSTAIRWILSHPGLLGNEKADFIAKIRAERGGRLLDRWSSLAHIKKSLIDIRHKETTKWHETKMQEREASRCGYYIPWTKVGIKPILGNAPKKYASRYYQLKVSKVVGN